MFHNAGHTISYLDISRVDTALAKQTLSTVTRDSDTEHGTVIHVNLAEGRFIHFAVDNIDIKEGTLDGQNTLHWQTGQNQLASSRTLRRLRESNPQSPR